MYVYIYMYIYMNLSVYDEPYFKETYYLLNKLITGVIYFLKILCFMNQLTIELSIDNLHLTFFHPQIYKYGIVQNITLV